MLDSHEQSIISPLCRLHTGKQDTVPDIDETHENVEPTTSLGEILKENFV